MYHSFKTCWHAKFLLAHYVWGGVVSEGYSSSTNALHD